MTGFDNRDDDAELDAQEIKKDEQSKDMPSRPVMRVTPPQAILGSGPPPEIREHGE